MSAVILVGDWRGEISDGLEWTVSGSLPEITLRRLERILSRAYGPRWEPPAGVYIPDRPLAIAQAAVEDLGGRVVYEDPPEELPDNAIP